MIQRRKFTWLLMAALLLFAAAACGGGEEATPTPAATTAGAAGTVAPSPTPGKPFTIDLIQPYSGSVGFYGEGTEKGMKLALELKYGGAINGRPIEFRRGDNECKPEAATNAVNRVLDSATLIYGMTCSGASLAVIPVIDKAGIPQVDAALSDALTKQGATHYFQVSVRTSAAVKTVLQYMKQQGIKSFGALLDDTAYSQTAKPFIEQYAKELGLAITGFYEYKNGDTDFSAILGRAKSDNPDALFQYAYEVEAGLIAKQMRQLGMQQPYYGGTTFVNKEFLDAAGGAAEGSIFAVAMLPDDPDPTVQEFVKAYRDKYGEDPGDVGVLGYSAGLVIFKALESIGTDWTRDSITEALRKVSIQTPMGKISFDSTGAPVGLQPVIGVIKNGKPSFLARPSGP